MSEPPTSIESEQASQPGAPGSPQGPGAVGFRATRLWAWLQLFRVPNLLTVPGDPIAGFLLAQAAVAQATRLSTTSPGIRMALAGTVCLLIYAAGLLWNDWCDRLEDLRDRPGRPLPSGRIRAGQVSLVANALIAAAVAVAAVASTGVDGRATLWVAVALGAVVLAYDIGLKRVPLLGPLAMGACRGLSVLVGAAAFGREGLTCPPVIAASVGITLYVAAVTWLASGETRQRTVTAQKIAIAVTFAAWVPAVTATLLVTGAVQEHWRWAMLLLGVLAGLWLVSCLAAMGRRPEPQLVQRQVGGLIRGVILVQAALVLVAGWQGLWIAVVLMACFLLNRALGRLFYAS